MTRTPDQPLSRPPVAILAAQSLGRSMSALAVLICAIAVAVAYSNSTQGAFALDDWHTIQSNPRIRSLANIPSYFADPNTFSVLPTNIDYRPVLQVTYAMNYAWSKVAYPNYPAASGGPGYDPRPWHWTNLFLHFIVCVSLYFLGRRLIGTGGLANLPGIPPRHGDWIALVAAALFAVHPVTTACANYMSARSTLLVAAFALPALNLYLRVLSNPARPWPLLPSLLLYALALFTKVEAVSLMPVLILAEMLLAPEPRELPLWRRPLRARPWLRLAAFIAVTIVYLAIWNRLSPLTKSDTRAATGMGSWQYLCTQFSAWWYYIGHILAPVRLVADEQDFPISHPMLKALELPLVGWTIRVPVVEARTVLALFAWLLVIYAAGRACWRAPAVTLLVASFLLFLLPHSSVVVLAEMVNEHRPYLASAGLFILGAAGLYSLLARIGRWPVVQLVAVAALLAIPLTALTRERNLVWTSDLTLWEDTATKSPNSSRAQMNYGLALMRIGRMAEAESRYRDALRLAPRYTYIHTNLAIVLDARGDLAGAAASHDNAVSIAPRDSTPYYWRGTFRARHGDLANAIADFELAASLNASPFRELAALTECALKAGRNDLAQRAIDAGRPMDPAGFDVERAAFRRTYLGGG